MITHEFFYQIAHEECEAVYDGTRYDVHAEFTAAHDDLWMMRKISKARKWPASKVRAMMNRYFIMSLDEREAIERKAAWLKSMRWLLEYDADRGVYDDE